MHRHLLHNGSIHKTSEKLLTPGQTGLMNGWGVFSTIRVFDGVLFAYERHLARMRKDAALLGVPFPFDHDQLRQQLISLVEANDAFNSTLRVCVVRNRGGLFEGDGIGRDADLIAFTTDIHRWGDGVLLTVQPHGRHAASEFAGAKVLSWAFNLTWLERARAAGFDEVILLNEHGHVAECTSANLFISMPGGVFTPPLSAGCLPGVTRQLLLGPARPPSLTIEEKNLSLDDLFAADSVFITSTTRELLPVLSINRRTINNQGDARQIMQDSFSRHADEYVRAAPVRARMVRSLQALPVQE